MGRNSESGGTITDLAGEARPAAGRRGGRPGTGIAGLAFRNLLSRPSRTLLAMVGLTVPIVGAIGMLGLSSGLRGLIDDTLGQVQGIIVLRQNAPVDLFSELPAAMGPAIAAVPGVRAVAPQVWKLAPPIEGRRTAPRVRGGKAEKAWKNPLMDLLKAVVIEGQDIPAHGRLRHEVYRDHLLHGDAGGRFLGEQDRGKSNVVISATIAREYPGPDGRPRAVGEALRIGGEPFLIIGVYDTGSLILDGTIIMDIAVARRLSNTSAETVSCFLVEPAVPAAMPEVARSIRRAIRGVDARTMADFRIGIDRLLGKLDRLLLILVGLALAVGSAGVLNTMLMSTTERLSEFGILRTNGWTRGNVLALVLGESLGLGLASGILGCVLAAGALAVARPSVEGSLRVETSAAQLASCLALSVILAGCGGAYPAWHASRLAPMETIRIGSR
ncbi:putative ABC transporter permease YknZ [Aquisphaera giovannonii]|uniref:Putative ABC transporter permease YknZ n=2 Tax=Aquisphaera giovannonii TaxID=406548 RepID=A0A5B9W219_9BACT|nr:putative ABC transporter permease YknZ [Aquisphaera giovannonii]